MSSSFTDSFDIDHLPGEDSQPAESTLPFDDEPHSFSDPVEEPADEDSQAFNTHHESSFQTANGAFPDPEVPLHSYGEGFPAYSPEDNGAAQPDNGVFVGPDGPVLPPPSEMREEGYALREWRRQNASLLEEKEKREKQVLSQILQEANDFKVAFYEKRKATCETNKTSNREKEKLFVANHESFHKEADKNYWKSIAELIPNEVPAIQKRGKKKDQENKPSIVVVQGPKPGKPTDLSRMRQILIKLKHETPSHLKLSPPAAPAKDSKATSTEDSPVKAVDTTPEAVVAA